MLNWNLITDPSQYTEVRYDLLVLLEGVTLGPYVDTVGDPTIGIGFNLVYNLAPVLEAMVGNAHWDDRLHDRLAAQINRDYAPGQNALLANRLDKVMADWHDRHDSAVPSGFHFRSSAEINRALDLIAPDYDAMIDGWISGLPDSSERAALFSMTWNAPSLLGPKLKAAIETGDRAEAWYEIRYNSNGGQSAGIANRRYVEADMFGLYDREGRANFAQAIETGQMYAAHRLRIIDYEDRFDPATAATVKGIDTITAIDEALDPAIARILRRFGLTANLKLEELLAAGNGQADLLGDGTAFDSKSNDADLLIGDSSINRLSGGNGRDVIVGRGGNDVLTGGAGADLFVFASKADGRDKITDFRDGSDRLVLNALGDLTLLEEKGSGFSGAGHEVRWFTSNGDTIVQLDLLAGGGSELTIRLKGLLTIDATDLLL